VLLSFINVWPLAEFRTIYQLEQITLSVILYSLILSQVKKVASDLFRSFCPLGLNKYIVFTNTTILPSRAQPSDKEEETGF
jgi:hypothetical protein